MDVYSTLMNYSSSLWKLINFPSEDVFDIPSSPEPLLEAWSPCFLSSKEGTYICYLIFQLAGAWCWHPLLHWYNSSPPVVGILVYFTVHLFISSNIFLFLMNIPLSPTTISWKNLFNHVYGVYFHFKKHAILFNYKCRISFSFCYNDSKYVCLCLRISPAASLSCRDYPTAFFFCSIVKGSNWI